MVLKEKRRSGGEVSFSIHGHMSEFGSTKEQPTSLQVSVLISDNMAAIAKLVLGSEHGRSF